MWPHNIQTKKPQLAFFRKAFMSVPVVVQILVAAVLEGPSLEEEERVVMLRFSVDVGCRQNSMY